jgi:hypothetical protein
MVGQWETTARFHGVSGPYVTAWEVSRFFGLGLDGTVTLSVMFFLSAGNGAEKSKIRNKYLNGMIFA